MKKKKIIGYATSLVMILLSIRCFWIMKYETTSDGFGESGYARWQWMSIMFGVVALIIILKTYTDHMKGGDEKTTS